MAFFISLTKNIQEANEGNSDDFKSLKEENILLQESNEELKVYFHILNKLRTSGKSSGSRF